MMYTTYVLSSKDYFDTELFNESDTHFMFLNFS